MSRILCITNRKLCGEDFLTRVERIASAHPAGIILREKDLTETEYQDLAEQVMNICRKHCVPCVLHSFVNAAIGLKAETIHLPMTILRTMTNGQKARFRHIGASCHSVEDAMEAQRLGCTYITAGHIFPTDCKKDLPGRGLAFLRQVCGAVSVPVFAIGGIGPANICQVRSAGARGACLMSSLMTTDDVPGLLKSMEE